MQIANSKIIPILIYFQIQVSVIFPQLQFVKNLVTTFSHTIILTFQKQDLFKTN